MSEAQNEALAELLQRFAVSGLSKERKDEAVNEEILLGKYTGEFYIKSKDGIIISTDKLNRLEASTDSAIRTAELSGMTGELYKVELEKMDLPTHINYNINLLNQDEIVLPNNTKEFLLYLDLDEYDVSGIDLSVVNSSAKVKVIVEATIGGNVEYVLFRKSLQNINYCKMELNLDNASELKIRDITIECDDDRHIVLHNIFVTIGK